MCLVMSARLCLRLSPSLSLRLRPCRTTQFPYIMQYETIDRSSPEPCIDGDSYQRSSPVCSERRWTLSTTTPSARAELQSEYRIITCYRHYRLVPYGELTKTVRFTGMLSGCMTSTLKSSHTCHVGLANGMNDLRCRA